jgi:hypothetical protein
MNISFNWLRDFVDVDLTPAALADLITSRAATVDAVEPLRQDLQQFVVARVVECARHPDSDHLSVTKVDAGTGELLDVVCGAPNVQAGKLSLIVHAAATLKVDQPLCGLLVDEWVEVVPSSKETTAIAFQFNPPDACAPQSVLLAVPPVPDQPWTVASLHRVLVETLDLAKLRAVDAEALGEIGHYMPALFFAFNSID